MKTFDQCKDEVAIKNQWKEWSDLVNWHTEKNLEIEIHQGFMQEVAELYAQEVAKDAWDRACEAQRNNVLKQLQQFGFVYAIEVLNTCSKPPYQPNQEKP